MKVKILIAATALFIGGCATLESLTESEAPAPKATAPEKAERFPYAPPSARVEPRDEISRAELDAPTQVVVLGTGTPVPDAYRAGPSIAVVHRGKAYLFDVGAGATRRAVEARYKYNIPALYPSHIEAVFITHMHSDHIVDLPVLTYTLWWRRPKQLKVFGPTGIKDMVKNMAQTFAADVKARIQSIQPVPNPIGYQVEAREIEPGVIFNEDGISIEAFRVHHGDIVPAFGFKIVTDDLSVVISGDTTATEVIRQKAQGVDLLFHEAISWKGLSKLPPIWQKYHLAAHTLAGDVGKIAAEACPGKLILYHGLFYGTEEENLVLEAAENFDGEIILANDLDIFQAETDKNTTKDQNSVSESYDNSCCEHQRNCEQQK